MALSPHLERSAHDRVVTECFAELWKHSVDLMFIMAVEPDGEFSLYDNNPASREVMGLDANEPIHRLNIRETWDDDIVEGIYATYRKAIEAKKPVSFEQYAMQGDKPVFVDTLFVPIFDDEGNPIFICGVARDISTIKEAEQVALDANAKLEEYSRALEQINSELDEKVELRTQALAATTKELELALAAKSSFVSRMSHEIRTPINAMLGLTNLLKKSQLDHVQQGYVKKIIESGNLLMGLVNDILDLSKIEADKLEPEQIAFDPQELFKQSLSINHFKASEKQLEFLCYLDPMMPRKLIGDPLRIQQIVTNLLSNALKFTHSGTVSLEVCFHQKTQNSGTLEWTVSDTGIGIAPQQLDTLFTSFAQADPSISRRYGGSGLGLSICKKLSELMHGEIEVSSVENQGSQFTVRVPVGIEEALSITDHITLARHARILVVERSEASWRLVNRMFTAVGFQVERSSSLGNALTMAKGAMNDAQPFDAILVDWGTVQGAHVQSTLRIIHKYQKLDKLLLTAPTLQSVVNYGLEGSCFLIEKPLLPESVFPLLGDIQISKTEQALEAHAQCVDQLRGQKLLLVDDNPLNLQVAIGFLADYGLQIDTANDGQEAIDRILAHDYDLVLMDLQMPNLDGISATRRLRAITDQAPPIIALTAYTAESTIQECIESGMVGHLSKPLVEAELQFVLLEHLGLEIAELSQAEQVKQEEWLKLLEQNGQLDTLSALERINTRYPLYFSLLETFYQRYHNSVLIGSDAEISPARLREEVHNLKSSADYIGASDVANAARDIERKLQENQLQEGGYQEALAYLSTQLASLIDWLRPKIEILQQQHFDLPTSIIDGLVLLAEQLERSDFACEATLNALLSQTNLDEKMREQLLSIQQLVAEVEFESGYLLAREICASLNNEASNG